MRRATLTRKTAETDISVALNLSTAQEPMTTRPASGFSTICWTSWRAMR